MMEEQVGVLNSQRAQDVAAQTGVAYKDIGISETERAANEDTSYDPNKVSSQLEAIQFKEPESYIDRATGTVAGQLNTLLSSDNPYIKLNEQKAQEQAGSRGLLNTTMAAGAGRQAAIQSALPIAQQDAETYNKFQFAKQDADYGIQKIQGEGIVSSGLVEQKAAIERKNTAIQNAFNANLAGATEESKVWLGDLQQTYNLQIQNLENLAKESLLGMELTSDQAKSVTDAASGIVQNYQITVENMLTDPDFLKMGKDAVNNAINQVQTLATNSIRFIGASQGIDLDAFVDTYFADLSPL